MRLIQRVARQIRSDRYLQRIESEPKKPETLPRLPDWIPIATPRYSKPTHLAPLTDDLERINAGEIVNGVYHAPPLCAKSDTIAHGIAWMLKQHPAWRFGYESYVEDQAVERSRAARDLARLVGLKLKRDGANDWETEEGGGVFAAGQAGDWTGKHFHVLIIDDPVKDRVAAESSALREKTWQWFEDVASTRLYPNASTIVIGARWHVDDLGGRLIARRGWPYKRMPAVIFGEDGSKRPLWPEMWTLERLAEIEAANAWRWASLYMGMPKPRGGNLFGDPTVYAELPDSYRIAIGLDLAYTKKSYSDWCVAVVVFASGEMQYVREVVRMQAKSSEFKSRLRGLQMQYPTASWRWYRNTVEEGVVDLMANSDFAGEGIPINGILAREDKVVRAQPAATSWNAGRILVPQQSAWLDDFLLEVENFSGVNDEHDDQVDALAAAHDELATSSPLPSLPMNPTEAAQLRNIAM